MAEYIEREALLELYDMGKDLEEYAGVLSVPISVIRQNIKDMPAADVVPVVHGRWTEYEVPDEPLYGVDYQCSVCGNFQFDNWNYCPNWGARMDGE